MKQKRNGFSLIELLVVLAIIAAITTVAIRAVTGTQNQTRYQQTSRSLEDIRSSILGPANLRGPDGSAIVSGFVADVGRLPQVIGGSDPLAELTNQGAILPFTFHNTSDPAIKIGTGWQGPYVRLGPGQAFPRDGWGRTFEIRNSLGGINNGTINEIRSLAADNKADDNGGGGDGYNLDVAVKIPTSGVGSASAQFSGYVKLLDSNDNPIAAPPATFNGGAAVKIWVRYFGPDGAGGVTEISVPVPDVATAYQIDGAGVTIGPRILRAYVLPDTPPSIANFNVADALIVSQPLTVVGTGGGQTVPTLLIKFP